MVTAIFPGATVGYGLNQFHDTNELGNSTLSLALSGLPATLSVSNADSITAWPTANFTVRIENELIFCTSRSGSAITIGTRGALGTSVSDHAFGTIVRVTNTSQNIQQARAEIMAMQGWAGVGASLVHAPVTTTPYTALSTDAIIPVDATAANATINLPTAVGIKGRLYLIVKTDASANTVTVDGNASETVGGLATQTLAARNSSLTIHSDGANWILANAPGAAGNPLDATPAAGVSGISVTGPIVWSDGTAYGLTPNYAANRVTLSGGTGAGGAHSIINFQSGAGSIATLSTAWNAGDKFEVVVAAQFNRAALDAGKCCGFGISGQGANPSVITAYADTTDPRVYVGVKSSGNIFIWTCNGSATTETDSGVAYTSGYVRVKIVWTKGTNAVVTLDSSAVAPITATIPTYISAIVLGRGANAGGTATSDVSQGQWRITYA